VAQRLERNGEDLSRSLFLADTALKDHDYNISGIPQFVRNPFTWAKFASLLVVDSPPPVGFSYCTQLGPSGNGTSCGPWNDTLTAQVNANFIVEWFGVFSNYLSNEFFITGESYAGVYVPIIARELLSRPEAKNIRLKGIATGDGCLGIDVLCGGPQLSLGAPWWDVVFFYGHAQIANEFFDELMSICTIAQLKAPTQPPACAAKVAAMYTAIGGFYEYNLYDYCPDNLFKKRKRNNPTYDFPGVGYPCTGTAMTTWINLPAVRRALNVPVNSFFFNADNGNDFVYVPTEPNVMTFYKHLLDTRPDIRMLVYNGDADPSLSSFRTQAAWFPYMKSEQVPITQVWRPWTLDNATDVRGYVQEWANNQFAFLTIRGSGHMVPVEIFNAILDC
jgi:serine carboxypeptidase-like clade 1